MAGAFILAECGGEGKTEADASLAIGAFDPAHRRPMTILHYSAIPPGAKLGYHST